MNPLDKSEMITEPRVRCLCLEDFRWKCPLTKVRGDHEVGDSISAIEWEDKASHSPVFTGVAKPERPSWDEYFLTLAKDVSTRATCDRKSVGAIIVDKRHRIVSTGYNGAAKGMPHCDEVGHLLKEVDGRESCVRTLHAESNALDDAGRRADGGTIYVTVIPCFNCALRIVNAGIRRVVWDEYYPSQNTGLVKEFFEEARIPYVSVHDGVTFQPRHLPNHKSNCPSPIGASSKHPDCACN